MTGEPTPDQIRQAVIDRPGDARAMFAWAGAQQRDRPSISFTWSRRASVADPLAGPPRSREALALLNLGRSDAAAIAGRRSVIVDPGAWSSWINLGVAQKRQSRNAESLRTCARARAAGAPDRMADMNEAVLRLRAHDYEAGWPLYRARYRGLGVTPSSIWPGLAEWDGRPIAGRLRILTEQGIGDTIMFLTLLHAVVARAGAITLLVTGRLSALLQRSFPQIQVVAPDDAGTLPSLPAAEAWICAGDLPAALGLFTGGAVQPRPYLAADRQRAARLRARLQRRHPGKRLVGITWTSQAEDGWRRTLPPALWQPLSDIDDIALVSLQYSATERDLATFGARIDASHGIEPSYDLDGLAALVAAMDMVISPTNNTVHFAGALGVACHVMLQVDPDWRWGEDGDDCRWYDATRLYRQRRDGDWLPVVADLDDMLRRPTPPRERDRAVNQSSLALLQEGIRHQQAGFRSRAAKLYRRVPVGDPFHADALNLLGTISFEEGRATEAASIIEQAARANPGNAAVWGNLGGVAKHLDRLDIAVACYRRAILLAPQKLEATAGMSLAVAGMERARALRRRVVISPLDIDGTIEAGNDLTNAGEKAAAAARFRRALLINPRSFAAVFNLGNALRDMFESPAAEGCYARALSIDPTNANVLNNRGLLYFHRHDWATAETWFERAIRAFGAHAPAWGNLARARQKLSRDDEAALPFKRALISEPQNMRAWCELAGLADDSRLAQWGYHVDPFRPEPYNRLALLSTKDASRKDVLPWLRKGACMRPDDPDSWYNIGVELGRVGDAASASKYGQYATRIRDNHALAHLNTALALLVQERFEEGWEAHRRRLDSPEAAPFVRYFSVPEWIDQDLAGRRLLIWGEQGIGDEIQFLTLLPHLLRRGAALTVLTEPRIRPILKRSFPGITVPDVSNPSGDVEDHHGCEFQAALGDLPHRLKLFCGGDELPVPWIVPDRERVATMEAGLRERHPGQRLVGITWRSVAPKTGGRRTIPIEMWRRFVSTPGVAIVSLQYGLKQEDLDEFRDATDCDIDHAHGVEPILDLDGLAALVAAMDLVVCPANNTVHFAGALGKPCWTLLPTLPDWRWGQTRSDSLWYPATRVFRQETSDDWAPVMTRIADELMGWAAG